jgi:hypothetical protein
MESGRRARVEPDRARIEPGRARVEIEPVAFFYSAIGAQRYALVRSASAPRR